MIDYLLVVEDRDGSLFRGTTTTDRILEEDDFVEVVGYREEKIRGFVVDILEARDGAL